MKKTLIIFMALALVLVSLVNCMPKAIAEDESPFTKFKGKDFEGNEIDETIFSKNVITVLNFWFNGCTACVNEMKNLDEFNKQLLEKGAEIIGVNVEASNDPDALEEAKTILKNEGANYRNIIFNPEDPANGYSLSLMAFPTTILVDRQGNIIGKPIAGAIDNPNAMKMIMDAIDEQVTKEKASTEKK